eukprot:scaffold14764_cov40-Phaeocystis_antarctica.AAC.1
MVPRRCVYVREPSEAVGTISLAKVRWCFLHERVDCLRDPRHSLQYGLALVVAQRVAEALQEPVRVPAERCGAVGLPSLGCAEAARIEP